MKGIILKILSLIFLVQTLQAQETPKPLRVLLVIGGCCHDYGKQKDILKEGIEKRANVVVEVAYSEAKGTDHRFDAYSKENWAEGFDAVIHDECSSDVKEFGFVEKILKAHRDGVPAVNLHCAMHSYRTGTPLWFEFVGLESSSHGPQEPISVTYVHSQSPITRGLENWITVNEELYNNIMVWGTVTPLARGRQGAGDKPGVNDTTVVWTNLYGKNKTRVFNTTLGHNNQTVSDDRYLTLVTRGLLWATQKLNDDGTPKPGYEKGSK
jgi:type 1 glutamine amidotransferase